MHVLLTCLIGATVCLSVLSERYWVDKPDDLFSSCQLVIYREQPVIGFERRVLYLLSGLNRFTWHRWQEKQVRDSLIFRLTVALRFHIMRALFTCILLHTNVLLNNSGLHWNESAETPAFSCQLRSDIAAVQTCSFPSGMRGWYLSVSVIFVFCSTGSTLLKSFVVFSSCIPKGSSTGQSKKKRSILHKDVQYIHLHDNTGSFTHKLKILKSLHHSWPFYCFPVF